MTERRKLELQLNSPTEIELLFEEPILGKSQYIDGQTRNRYRYCRFGEKAHF